MNLVALIGNVDSEPDLTYTNSGRAICTFTLAVERPGSDHTDRFTVAAWERQAEVSDKYLHVGRRVGIEGRLHHSVLADDDGQWRSEVTVLSHRVQLLGQPPITREG